MTNVYRTVPAVLFAGLEDALAKYGIGSSSITLSSMTLIGASGTVVARMEQGYVDFTRACGDVRDIFEAIEAAFGTSVLDEDDWDLWCRNNGLVPAKHPCSLLIEGPPISDARIACNWVKRIQDVDDALQAHPETKFLLDGEVRLVPPRLLLSCAMDFLPDWFARDGVFHVNMAYTQHTVAIRMMVAVGFLRNCGVRYQMTLPEEVDAQAIARNIRELLHQLAIILPVVMYREDAEALARSIRLASRQAHSSLRSFPTGAAAAT